MRGAQGQSRHWTERARCRRNPNIPQFAWTVMESDSGPLLLDHEAETWIAMALMVCRNCPAQYDCARFAIAADEKWGTWAMPLEDLKRLKKDPWAARTIDVAEELGTPVQVAVREALKA